MKRIAVGVIKLYQIVRKPFPPVCRFTPSCSQYAVEALQKYGFWKGSFLSLKRVLRCHPFQPGGHDPLI